MCVIIAKSKAANAPALDIINRAMTTNPHGFALVYAKGGKLHTFRTMDAKEMRKYYSENFALLDSVPFVFHARISTHGARTLANCHGWPTDGGRAAFFHNGILDIRNRGNMTDSETFLRDIYEPAAKCGPEAARRAINAVIGGSKFAFIYDTGEIRMYGHYIKVGGVYYSNLNHMPPIFPPHYTPTPSASLPFPRNFYEDLERFGW